MSEQPTPETAPLMHAAANESIEAMFRRGCDLEHQLADALAQLRIADEQLALERGALAEARRLLESSKRECDNALSDWRQADRDTVRALYQRNEARDQRDALAGLLEKSLRYMHGCPHKARCIAALAAAKETTPEQP